MKKVISSRQIAIMISISMLTFKLTYLPALLYKDAFRDGFVSFLILLLLDLLSFALVITIFVKHKDESFSEFLEKRIGVVASKFIYLLIFLFFFGKLIFLSNAGYYFSRESIFQESEFIVFLATLFIVINSLYLFKINSFARTIEMCYPVVIFALLLCVILGQLTTKPYGILPLFESGAENIIQASWHGLFCFGDYIFLLPLMGKVKVDNKFAKRLVLYMSISLVLLILLAYSFFSFFRYTGFLHQHAITDVIEFVPLSSIIENLDLFPVSLMLMMYIFHGTQFLFCMVNPMKEIFKFKHKRYDSRWILLFVNIIALFLIYFVFSSFDNNLNFFQTYMSWYTVVCIIFVPTFCFLISFKKVKEKEQIVKWKIKVNNEDLKWPSGLQDLKQNLALTKKIKFGGQKT